MTKQFAKGLVMKVNEDFTLEVAVASTGIKDRQGEIIEPTAWRLDNFKRNPVLQWAHDYRSLPIGRVEDIAIEETRLIFKPRFAADIDEFAKKVWQMYKGGFLNAFSVGFNPIKDKEGDKWTDVELLEISAVPVPANPEALVLARELGVELEEEKETKPAPEIIGDYIHIRVRNPELFVQDSFRTIDISPQEGIKAVIGKLKSDQQGSTVIQKFLFDKEKWTVDEAVTWVSEHKESAKAEEEEKPEETTPPVEEKPVEEEKPIEEPKIITEENEKTIKTAIESIKITADALSELLANSKTEKDNVGGQNAGSFSGNGNALHIVRSALKQADRQIEKANRSIKIIMERKEN